MNTTPAPRWTARPAADTEPPAPWSMVDRDADAAVRTARAIGETGALRIWILPTIPDAEPVLVSIVASDVAGFAPEDGGPVAR